MYFPIVYFSQETFTFLRVSQISSIAKRENHVCIFLPCIIRIFRSIIFMGLLCERNLGMEIKAELMTATEAFKLWGISARRIQILCDEGRVKGAVRMGRNWIIPRSTAKHIDGRTKAAKSSANKPPQGK